MAYKKEITARKLKTLISTVVSHIINEKSLPGRELHNEVVDEIIELSVRLSLR